VSTIRIPRKEQERTAALRRSAQAVAQQLGHEASLAETAKAAGIALDDARVALAGPAVSVPLSALEPHPSTAAADEFAACEDRQLVRELFSTLAPRERALVRLRFGEDLSQAEIGRLLDISQSQTSRLLSAALDKLRQSAERSDPWAA
jgi:RNA polymerase sigma-B factor